MSGGGNNATISMPGPGWGPGWTMLWPASFDSFQLDIVGFLAILGEGSVAATAQVSALSRLSLLPRLIPAPQALLWPTRKEELEPTTKASVTGIKSGMYKDRIHHVASILLSAADRMEKYEVRCIHISKSEGLSRQTSIGLFTDRALRGLPTKEKGTSPKSAGSAPAVLTAPTAKSIKAVKAKAAGPLTWVTLLDFTLSITLFTISIVFGDGMSMLATILLSLLSTLTGISNIWSLELPRRSGGFVPAGDTVIRYPKGSCLVIKCDEDVARELFFAPEEINYYVKSPAVYRLISLVGTLMLMLGVIALANARLELQFAWAGAYILTNAAHWIAAAVPSRSHWDFSCYTIQEQGLDGGSKNTNFTAALWKAIMVVGSAEWARNGDNAAPRSEAWNRWLVEANSEAELAHELLKEDTAGMEFIWPKKDSLWALPDRRQWQSKEEWNRINKELSDGKVTV